MALAKLLGKSNAIHQGIILKSTINTSPLDLASFADTITVRDSISKDELVSGN